MIKKILGIGVSSALALSIFPTSMLAANDVVEQENINTTIEENYVDPSSSEVSELFVNFIGDAFNDLDHFTVNDSNGLDITKEFIESTTGLYNNQKYKEIRQIVLERNLSLAYSEATPLSSFDLNRVSLTAVRSDSVSKQFYHIAQEKTGRYTKEWIVTLTGNISYDTSTYKITAVNSPTISLTKADFGALFAPALENVSTNGTHSGSTAIFSANYQMRALLGVSVGSLPLGFNLDFGTYYDSFSSPPPGLQN